MNMRNQRQTYGETLLELGAAYPNIVVCEADLGKSTMSILFGQKYPNRYFEMGIAEQNMASFAAGLALTGKIAFINSFAVFASGRTYDQIRQGICIPALDVKIVGSSSGLSDFGDGSTHQAVEDIAIMRAIPNMTVLSPMDAVETRKMVEAAVTTPGPFYLRISRNDLPALFPADQDFVIGKPLLIRDGKDVVIYATGVMVSVALRACEALEQKGISPRLVHVGTLKPLDEEALAAYAVGMRGVVTAEEHSVIGGLGSAVTYALRSAPLPTEVIGIQDAFGQSAQNYDELLACYGLTEEAVSAAVLKILGRDSAL